jgi:hypothetical protein
MLNLVTTFGSRANAATSSYPTGSYKDDTSATVKDGTPIAASTGNDDRGFRDSLLVEAGYTANNIVDTALASQAKDAAKEVFSRPALYHSCLEAGLNLVSGSFEDGGTVTLSTDVLWDKTDKKIYSWGGTLPKVVRARSTPATTGGVSAGAWVDRTQDTLKSELMSIYGSGMIGSEYTGTIKQTLTKVLTPEMFLAVGDGVTDDTAAFNALDAFLYANRTTPFNIVLNNTYIVNPTGCTHAFGSSNARLFSLYCAGSKVSGIGLVKVSSAFSYSSTPGSEFYWAVVRSFANDCLCTEIGFNGNGKHTGSGYNPSITNIRFELFACLGVASVTQYSNNQVVGCRGKDFGGQAVSIQYCDDAKALRNSFYGHTGIAISAGSNPVIAFNVSRNCYDAHIGLNGGSNASVCFNYSDTTSNGSGIDIVGVNGFAVFGNETLHSFGSGIKVSYSAQLGVGSIDGSVYKNRLTANCRYTGSPVVSEIMIGNPVDTGLVNATNIIVDDNTIYLDGSISSNSDRALFVGFGASNVSLQNNKIKGVHSSSGNTITIAGTTPYLTIVGNEWSGDTIIRPILISSPGQSTPFVCNKNKGLAINYTSSTFFPDSGVMSDDGWLSYSVERDVTTGGLQVLTVPFSASNDMCEIIVDVVQRGDTGAVQQRIIARGNSAVTTAVLSNTSVWSFGTNPPTVTVDTTTTGQLKVSVVSTGATRISKIGVKVKAYEGINIVFR